MKPKLKTFLRWLPIAGVLLATVAYAVTNIRESRLNEDIGFYQNLDGTPPLDRVARFDGTTGNLILDYGLTVTTPTPNYSANAGIATVGAVANEQQALASGDFPNTTTLNIFSLEDANSDFGTGGNLTEVGSPAFNGRGFYDRGTVLNCDGVDDVLTSSSAEFDIIPQTDDFSFSIWATSNWDDTSATLQELVGVVGASNLDYLIQRDNVNDRMLFYSGSGTNLASHGDISERFDDGEWVHFGWVSRSSDNTTFIYINGQLIGSGPTGGTDETVADFSICDRAAGSFRPWLGKVQDFAFHKGTVLTAAEINAIYSRRFPNFQQLAGGHTLIADSFSYNPTGLSWWTLDDDLTDDSANARNLTAAGGLAVDAVGLFGAASTAVTCDGTDNQATSTDADLLVPSGGTSLSSGAWVYIEVFSNDFLGSAEPGFGTEPNGYGWGLQISTSGILFNLSEDGTGLDFRPSVGHTATGVKTKEWRHIAGVYDSVAQVAKLYLDGVEVASLATPGLTLAETQTFRVCTVTSGTFFNGRIAQVFYENRVYSPDEILKLASSRITHSAGIADQVWQLDLTDEFTADKIPLDPSDYILDKSSSNDMFLDLSGLPVGADLDLTLKNF